MYRFVVDLLHPVTLLFLLAAIGVMNLWWRRTVTRRGLLLLVIPLLLLALFCTPAISFLAAGIFEWQFPPLEQRPEGTEAIVVLGGGVQWPAPGDAETRPTDGTLRRCFAAAELYRRGSPCPILVAGGIVDPSRHWASESDVMRDCLLTMGIPASDIITESESRNTYESAVRMKRLLAKRGISSTVLVTDATHLLRATLCFRKQGLKVAPAGAYYRANYFHVEPFAFVPRAGAARENQDVLHEALGLAWYWWHGRI